MIDESVNSCAVVGNGPNILKKEYGESIDSYDKIIRCNLGLVKGFEKFVGSRTDFRLINCHVHRTLQQTSQKLNSDNFTCLKTLNVSDIVGDNEIIILKDIRAKDFVRDKNMESEFKKKSNVYNSVYRYNETILDFYRASIHYSGGVFAALLGLYIFPNAQIDMYGFTFYQGATACSHYYEEVKGISLNHPYDKEKSFIESQNRIRIIW